MITQDRLIDKDPGFQFKYIAHGKFIVDCFEDRDLFEELVELLEEDVQKQIEDEKELSVKENRQESELVNSSQLGLSGLENVSFMDQKSSDNSNNISATSISKDYKESGKD